MAWQSESVLHVLKAQKKCDSLTHVACSVYPFHSIQLKRSTEQRLLPVQCAVAVHVRQPQQLEQLWGVHIWSIEEEVKKVYLRLLDLSLQLLWRLLASVLLSMDEDLGWEGRWSLSPTPHRGWSKYLTSSNQPVYYMSDTVTKQFPVATLSEMMSISMWSTVFSFPGVRRRRYLCCSLQATSRVLTTILTVGIARLSNFSFGK